MERSEIRGRPHPVLRTFPGYASLHPGYNPGPNLCTCSPDEAQRNPGLPSPVLRTFPGYASLHPGYNTQIMVRYRRNFVPGGTYFFTVTLADRSSCALLDHIDALRAAFRITRRERSFTI